MAYTSAVVILKKAVLKLLLRKSRFSCILFLNFLVNTALFIIYAIHFACVLIQQQLIFRRMSCVIRLGNEQDEGAICICPKSLIHEIVNLKKRYLQKLCKMMLKKSK